MLASLLGPTARSHHLSRTLLIAIATVALSFGSADAGGWTQYTNANPGGGSGTSITLTDGTVMVVGNDGQSWYKLTPDSTGSYANGTWSQLASMGTARLYYGSNVMTNGKVFVLGGEYSGVGLAQNWVNTGEIYDPVANTWTAIPNFPQSSFGDDPTIVLPNGNILCGFLGGPQTYIFNTANNTWSQTGTKLRGDRSDEETWIALPDGTILSYDVFASDANQKGSAQKYDPVAGTWSDAGSVPSILSGSVQGYELGPGALLPNGKVIIVGANENIVLYDTTSKTWSKAPSLPTGVGADDAPGALLPNGQFVFLADSYLFNSPTNLYNYDYTTNTLSNITSTLPSGLANALASGPAFYRRMMITPDGHLMLGTGDSKFWDYTPPGTPQTTWAPSISGITKGSGALSNTYTLTGSRLTGVSQGCSYGDDVESDTNYPLIRLTGTDGTVRFARSTNWTPGVSAVGSTTPSTVQFTLPTSIPNGTYQLSVVANGIASKSVTFKVPFTTVTYNYVTATYKSGTLKLMGDAGANSVSVTQQGTLLTVQGAGSTLVNNSSQATFTLSGDLTVDCEFAQSATPPTNDAVTLVSVNSVSTTMNFGSGNDAATLVYCTIKTLSVDGGAGTDTLTLTGSKITTKTIKNIP